MPGHNGTIWMDLTRVHTDLDQLRRAVSPKTEKVAILVSFRRVADLV